MVLSATALLVLEKVRLTISDVPLRQRVDGIKVNKEQLVRLSEIDYCVIHRRPWLLNRQILDFMFPSNSAPQNNTAKLLA